MTVLYLGERWEVIEDYFNHLKLQAADGRVTYVADDDPELQIEDPRESTPRQCVGE
jgi:hypothetical protein